jgi:hypothetical protein
MYRSTHKESNKTGFSFLQFFYELLQLFKVSADYMHKRGKIIKGKTILHRGPGVLSN